MINFDVTKEIIKEHNPNLPNSWSSIQNISNIRVSGSGKTNWLFNLLNQQTHIDKFYLYIKDPYEAKYQFLITTHSYKTTGLKPFNDFKGFIEYLNDVNDIYKKTEEYNPNKKRKIMIVFDDTIADMLSNKKFSPIVTELFIRHRRLNIFLIFNTKSYFTVPKNIRLKSTHYFIMKTPNKRELQQNLHLLIHQILTLNTKNVLQNHILF